VIAASGRVPRVVSAAGVVVLLVALALAVSRTRTADDRASPTASPTPGATVPVIPPPPSPTPSGPSADADTLMRDPDAAEAAGAEALLAAGVTVAEGDWADLGNPAWPVVERPVYVGTASIEERARVDADVVVAFRTDEPTSELVLRLLPAASALTDVSGPPTVAVRRDARAAPHAVDRAGALLTVTLDPPLSAGEAALVRVLVTYPLIPRDQVLDDGGPAGFGLLAWNPEVSVLGHWLPLLTAPDDAGPMLPWGDVGAFPAAVWSLQVEHGTSRLVTGASDGPCPTRVGTDGCTWARGTALRDVSAVAYDDGHHAQRVIDGVLVRSFGPPSVDEPPVALALEEAIVGVELFTGRFGPLAWTEFDVAAVPLSSGAAGMEFPGLVLIRDDTYGALGAEFGSYVIAHEVAHQWFHALLGSGSLSSPVVDESLAQYASALYYDAVYGEAAAGEMVDRYLVGRYRRWRQSGGVEEPPGQPLDQFAGSASYGPLVYARGALAWLAAEDTIGREQVVTFVASLVDRFGLGFVSDQQVVAEARAFDQQLGEVLARYWFDPEPVP